MMNLYSQSRQLLLLPLLLLLLLATNTCHATNTPMAAWGYPEAETKVNKMTLRVAMITGAVPLCYTEDQDSRNVTAEASSSTTTELAFSRYKGYQPDLLRAIQRIAHSMHNITLDIQVEEAPPYSYTPMFELISNDCATSIATNPKFVDTFVEEDCHKYDLIVGDYYPFYPRTMRNRFTPSFIQTAGAALKYVSPARKTKREITTFAEAQAFGESICALENSFQGFATKIKTEFPDLEQKECPSVSVCLEWLKEEKCVLFLEDELELRFQALQDPELELVKESTFDEIFIVWPLNQRTLSEYQLNLMVAWIYEAKVMGIIDELYKEHFTVRFCPLGKAGPDCDKPCSPSHGISNRFGHCVCDSTRFTGEDCTVEVQEDLNLLPQGTILASYAMVAVNTFLVLICATWLYLNRHRNQVKVAQPYFLCLILLGCLISTSTIVVMAEEDPGDGPVPACMAMPWLYSVGFSITFGTLYAKIRRVYKVMQSAVEMRRVTVSLQETFLVVGVVLLIDVTILTVWTVLDPLQWQRTIITADQYGYALSSEGHCNSEHWAIFVSIIAAYHFLLMCKACYVCYLARNLPERFATKYVSIAVFSNMQILVVALPVLVILGADPQSSFFVRSVTVFINDFVVVSLIFGNLMYRVYHWDKAAAQRRTVMSSKKLIQDDIRSYAEGETQKKLKKAQKENEQTTSISSFAEDPANSGSMSKLINTIIKTGASQAMSVVSTGSLCQHNQDETTSGHGSFRICGPVAMSSINSSNSSNNNLVGMDAADGAGNEDGRRTSSGPLHAVTEEDSKLLSMDFACDSSVSGPTGMDLESSCSDVNDDDKDEEGQQQHQKPIVRKRVHYDDDPPPPPFGDRVVSMGTPRTSLTASMQSIAPGEDSANYPDSIEHQV